MTETEIRERFALCEGDTIAADDIRYSMLDAALVLRELIDGRELALAITKLEEAMAWALMGLRRG